MVKDIKVDTKHLLSVSEDQVKSAGTSSNMSVDQIDTDFFKTLLSTACNSRNVNKPKNVGTAMAMIFGAKKIKSRYPKIVRFLGKIECENTEIEKQFIMYYNLYEYLMNEVPNTDVSYWKQLLSEKEYKEPAEGNDLWSNIFGIDVNIKRIYMSDDGNILKQEEKQLAREESNLNDALNESDEEAFDPDFFENEFFSDEDEKCNEISSDSSVITVMELDYHHKEDFDLEYEEEKDSGSLRTHTEEYQNGKLHESKMSENREKPTFNIEKRKNKNIRKREESDEEENYDVEDQGSFSSTCGGTQVKNHLNEDQHRSKLQDTNAASALGSHLAAQVVKKGDFLTCVDKAQRCGMVSIHMEGKIRFYKCNVCNLSTSGLEAMTKHLKGANHRNVLRKNPSKKAQCIGALASCDEVPASSDVDFHFPVSLEELIKKECSSGTGISCSWCSVYVTGEKEVKQHLGGKRHIHHVTRKLGGLFKKEAGVKKCITCNTKLYSKSDVKAHLIEFRHKKKIADYNSFIYNTSGNNASKGVHKKPSTIPGMCKAWNKSGVCHHKQCWNLHRCDQCGGEHPRLNQCLTKIIKSGNEKGENAMKSRKPDTCDKYNNNQHCKLWRCKYHHVCEECGGDHPRSKCIKKGVPPPGISPFGIPSSGIPTPVSSIPNSCAPNLSIPPPGYNIPPPSPVVSPYIPHTLPPPATVSSIPITSASDLYIPQPWQSHNTQPLYIPSSVPPTPVSSIPIQRASDLYIPQPTNDIQPIYIPSPVPPPTPGSSIHIRSASDVSTSSPGYHIPPPGIPDLSASLPPGLQNLTGSYSMTSASSLSLPGSELSLATKQQHTKTEKLKKLKQDIENLAEKNQDIKDLAKNIKFDIRSSKRRYKFSTSRSPDEIKSKSKIGSRSQEKVYNKYDNRSPDRRHRKSESKSPERKHRKHDILPNKSYRKSEKSHNRTQGKILKSKSTNRQGRSSPKDILIEGACESLMSISDKIGILGHSLRAALEKTQKFRKDSSKIVETLSDSESQELLFLIAKRLKKLIDETIDKKLISVFTDASISTNLLLNAIKSYLETSNSDQETTEGIEHESKYSNDNSSIGSSAFNRIEVWEKKRSIEDPSINDRSSSKKSDDLTQEEKKLIQRITEGRQDNIRGCEKEYASTSGLHVSSAISDMLSGQVNSMEKHTDLQNEHLSTNQYTPKQFKSRVFKVAIFGHDYVDWLPVDSGRVFQSKTPGISYQVMKYSRHGAEIIKVQDYSIWTEVISAQPNVIFLILGKNDLSISASDVGNEMLQIKTQLERKIPNVDIVCFGLEEHSDFYWSSFQEELNRFLDAQFSMFISPATNINIGSERPEDTMNVWFHMREIIEHLELQQIMLNKFLPT